MSQTVISLVSVLLVKERVPALNGLINLFIGPSICQSTGHYIHM